MCWCTQFHDTLIGGGAPDWLFGGDGVDTASYRTAASAVTASLMTGAGARGDANGDEFNSIERLEGSAFDDELHGDDQTSCVTDWNQLSISQVSGGDVLISHSGNTIEIENMDADDFSANDFLFV